MTNEVSPLSILPKGFLPALARMPKSRIIFVTIKDNAQGTKWCKLGKASDWLRRYSDIYFIVKGTCGGTHFHAVAGLKPGANPTPVKGIHFHIKNLSNADAIALTREEVSEVVESTQKAVYYRRERLERLIYFNCDKPTSCLCVVSQIASMITRYWRLKADRFKRKRAKAAKATDLGRIIDYLFKNLDEPRVGSISQYNDYIVRLKL